MRSITDLLPDVRIKAPGVPEFLALYALTRSLSAFLDHSEAWREWGPTREVGDISDGLLTWSNHLDDDAQRWARVKRIDILLWDNTGAKLTFKTQEQLHCVDPQYRTRTGSVPTLFTNEGEGDGIQVRVYPTPDDTVDDTFLITPRFVVITDAVADMALSDYDDQIPEMPDRIFYPYREGIVAGAMAELCTMPGKDWTDLKLAATYRADAVASAAAAQSRANAEFGHPVLTVKYGGL